MMDFSSAFVSLRERMSEGQDKQFENRMNVEVAGRTAALLSSFGVASQRKLLGMVPMGGATHAHEYRLLFAAPGLTEQGLADWWEYALAAEQELVQPDTTHEFSLVSLILAADGVDRAMQKKIKRFAAERHFSGADQSGWSAVRIAVADLSTGKVHTNALGEPLRGILKPFLQKNT